MEKIMTFLKSRKKEDYIVCILIGILIIIIAWPVPKKDDSANEEKNEVLENIIDNGEQQTEEVSARESNMQNYRNELEQSLKEILSDIDGVGEVSVMITLATSSEVVVEKDIPYSKSESSELQQNEIVSQSKQSQSEEKTLYITGEDGEEVPYVRKTINPEIEGVLVVADGGGNTVVRKNITEAIEALFGLASHKIIVVKSKS